jgi:hypothetical protein
MLKNRPATWIAQPMRCSALAYRYSYADVATLVHGVCPVCVTLQATNLRSGPFALGFIHAAGMCLRNAELDDEAAESLDSAMECAWSIASGCFSLKVGESETAADHSKPKRRRRLAEPPALHYAHLQIADMVKLLSAVDWLWFHLVCHSRRVQT